MSVSRIRLVLEIKGKGRCECELARHLAPLTVGSILRALPIEGRVYRYDGAFIYMETGLTIGREKQRDEFKRGDIGFMVANGALCIFLKDVKGMMFNPLGRVINNIELLEGASAGDVLLLAST
ncbi:MAG: cyclophilin-like fold protein [Candidatus Nitrosocaldus sp.]